MATILDQATQAWLAQHPYWMPGPIAQPQSENVLEIPQADPYGPDPEHAGPFPASPVVGQPPIPRTMNRQEMELRPSVMEDPDAWKRRLSDYILWPGGRVSREWGGQMVNVPLEKEAQAISQAPPIRALGPRWGPLAAQALTYASPWAFEPILGAALEAVRRPAAPIPTRPTVPLGSQTLEDVYPNVNPKFKGMAIARGTAPLPEMEAAPQTFHGARRGPIERLLPPEKVADPTSKAGAALYATNDISYAREAAAPSKEATEGGPVYQVTEIPHYDAQGRPMALRFFDLDRYPLTRPQLEQMAREIPERIRNPRDPKQPIKARSLFRLNMHGPTGFEGKNAIYMLNRYSGQLPDFETPFEERVMQPEVVKAFRKVLGSDYDGVIYSEHPAGVPNPLVHKAYFNPQTDVHLSPMPESEWKMGYTRDRAISEMPPGGPYGFRPSVRRIGPPTVK